MTILLSLIGVPMAASQAMALPDATRPTVVAPAPAVSGVPPRPGSAPRRVALTVDVLIDGSPVGDVTVQADPSGSALVDSAQLLKLTAPVVSKAVQDALVARAGTSGFVPIATLNGDLFKAAFDLNNLRVLITIPVSARATSDISILSPRQFNPAGVTVPSNFAAGVTFNIGDHIQQVQDFGDFHADGFTVLADGFVNVGGIQGVNLTFQNAFQQGGPLEREQTTLFHDDVAHAVRYEIGDIDPEPFGSYDSSPSLLGIGVQRLYSQIQPYRNLRPAGLGSVQIERPSRVDVIVNGSVYRTLTLAPGQYNIRDFPFLDGLNDVQLVVRDDSGRQEQINLSFFSDTQLLQSGISIFSANVGFPREQFGNYEDTTYSHSPLFTGFYERGLTDRLTIGGSTQFDRHNALTTGEVAIGTKLGLFGVEAALDLNGNDPAQVAYLLSYRLSRPSKTGAANDFALDVQYTPAGFSPMTPEILTVNRFSYDITARYQLNVTKDLFATFGAGYSVGRGDQRDVRTLSVSLSQRVFKRLSVGVTYSYSNDTPRADNRIALTLSIPLSQRQFVRTGYDSDRDRVSADYELTGFEGLDDTSARVSLASEDDGQTADIDVEHYGNRYQAYVRHDYDDTAGGRTEFTDVGAAVGIGYADGRVAIGRDAARGFVIVAPHPTLGNATITASDDYSLGASAKTGVFGPALVPTQQPYQPNSIQVKVDNLPPGYDIGAGRIDIVPGAASGYLMTIGSAASNTVVGRVIDAAGAPAAYLSGTLVPISGKEAAPAQFFTNRTGRMVAQKVAPGRYSVTLLGTKQPVGIITVPQKPDGVVDIGTLKIGD